MTQVEMDILDFLETFGALKVAILTVQDRENAGSFEWADKSRQTVVTLQTELKEKWANCSDRLRDTQFKDLPVSVGPIETTLSEWLDPLEEVPI